MLFHSSIRKELARSFGATLVVLAPADAQFEALVPGFYGAKCWLARCGGLAGFIYSRTGLALWLSIVLFGIVQVLLQGDELARHAERWMATAIYDRSKLRPQMRFQGPAIVTEFDSTTVVLPGYVAEVDVNFNILINPND